jgi:hypothetical protein
MAGVGTETSLIPESVSLPRNAVARMPERKLPMPPCRRSQRWAVTALLALAAVDVQAELRFRIQELGYEGRHGPSEFFWPAALNNHGQVVGYLQQEVPQDDYTELLAAAYVSRGSRLLPLLGGSALRAGPRRLKCRPAAAFERKP